MSVTATQTETPTQEAVRKGPPHKVSPVATRAARILSDFLTFVVKPNNKLPNILADVRCLAIVIDLTSNIYRVSDIRPELHYWQRRVTAETATAPQIGLFLTRLIEALETVYFEDREKAKVEYVIDKPMYLTSSSGRVVKIPVEPRHVICGAAMAAADGIYNYYDVVWTTDPTRTPKISQVAGIIDTTVHMYRAVRILEPLRVYKSKIARGELTIQEITDLFKLIGINLDYLPSYEEREEQRQHILA